MLSMRKEQMKAFSEYMRKSFEDRMVKHIAQTFPAEYEEMLDPETGDKPVRELVREGVERASRYEVTSERNVAMFIELMVDLSRDFDKRPQTAWTCEILEDPELPEDGKMDAIYDELEAQEQAPEDEEL